jgi:ubiquinone/menaquinone biosynthesis C-methylase UbiE
MAEINLLDRYPRTSRPIESRAKVVTEADKALASQFGRDYFDGDRRHGYGGYHYHPRFWQESVKRIRDHFELAANASVLDIGCGKGFTLYDFKELMPELTVTGLDISEYALGHAPDPVKGALVRGTAEALPFDDDSFDLVLCMNTVHNLPVERCKTAIQEIQRVSKQHAFLTVDAWRNDAEKDQLWKWVVTCLTAMHVDDWTRLFSEVGYSGDFYWFFPE